GSKQISAFQEIGRSREISYSTFQLHSIHTVFAAQKINGSKKNKKQDQIPEASPAGTAHEAVASQRHVIASRKDVRQIVEWEFDITQRIEKTGKKKGRSKSGKGDRLHGGVLGRGDTADHQAEKNAIQYEQDCANQEWRRIADKPELKENHAD